MGGGAGVEQQRRVFNGTGLRPGQRPVNACSNTPTLEIEQVKEKLCFVSYDYERDIKLARETTVLVKSYTLPDGRVIKARDSSSFVMC